MRYIVIEHEYTTDTKNILFIFLCSLYFASCSSFGWRAPRSSRPIANINEQYVKMCITKCDRSAQEAQPQSAMHIVFILRHARTRYLNPCKCCSLSVQPCKTSYYINHCTRPLEHDPLPHSPWPMPRPWGPRHGRARTQRREIASVSAVCRDAETAGVPGQPRGRPFMQRRP